MTHPLYDVIDRLESARVYFTLHRTQPDQVMIAVTLVGHRIEVYVSSVGEVTFSRFVGTTDLHTDLPGSEYAAGNADELIHLISRLAI